MNWKNKLTGKLNIDYPFVQAPMLGVTSPAMVSAVSNAGALGSLPLGLTNASDADSLIKEVKEQCRKPFSVNLFVYGKPVLDKLPQMQVLRSFYDRYGLPFPEAHADQDPFPPYEDLIDCIISLEIPVVSFTFGIPESSIVDRLKSAGCLLIGSASTVEETKLLEEHGMDMVVAQGIEAGGHRATFHRDTLPQTGLMSLLTQAADSVKIPVIAAGGLMEARSIAAAFILGATGVQLGSAFLRSKESLASDAYKSAVAAADDNATVLTNAWTGKFARALKNDFSTAMKTEDILPYPYQIYFTSMLRKKGRQLDSADIQSFWAGQSCRYARDEDAGSIISQLISETGDKLTCGLSIGD